MGKALRALAVTIGAAGAAACGDNAAPELPEPEALGPGWLSTMAIAEAGDAIVLWTDDQQGLWARARDPAQDLWSPAIRLAEQLYDPQQLHVPISGANTRLSLDAMGRGFAVWRKVLTQPASHYFEIQLWGARFDPSTGWATPTLLQAIPDIELPSGVRFQAVLSEDGTAHLVYATETALWAMRQQTEVAWTAPKLLMPLASTEGGLAVTTESGGEVIASWSSGTSWWWARYAPGLEWGTPWTVPSATGANVLRLNGSPDGSFVTSWTSEVGSLWVQRHQVDGNWESPTRLEDYSSSADVTSDDHGRALAVWTKSAPGEDTQARYAHYDPVTGWSSPALVAERAVLVTAASDRDGGTFVAWSTDFSEEMPSVTLGHERAGHWGTPSVIPLSPGALVTRLELGTDAAGTATAAWTADVCLPSSDDCQRYVPTVFALRHR